MKIHHLNCGSINLPLGVGLVGGDGGLFKPAPGVIHCLLIDTGGGLALVDTGFGQGDVLSPNWFMNMMMRAGGSAFDLEETAFQQVKRLGYAPEDVKHIILTHFHYDHAGGIPDFPHAKIHIFRQEYEAVLKPPTLMEYFAYRPEHWAHGPEWQVHDLEGDDWFGLPCTPLVQIGELRFCLVPMPGHTRGHCAVALQTPEGWLLHCGDAYMFHGHVHPEAPYDPPYHKLVKPIFGIYKTFRVIGQHAPRLRQVLQQHPGEIQLFCAHSLTEFEGNGY